MPDSEAVFECKKCGQCCEGRGGIVLSPKDLTRLAAFLMLAPDDLIARFCEQGPEGKLEIRVGSDGFCVFFKSDLGCSVHEGKPDICRAWPYFRGNLVDPVSLEMARDFCPGINKNTTFEDFAQFGRDYIKRHGLRAVNAGKEANALILRESESVQENG